MKVSKIDSNNIFRSGDLREQKPQRREFIDKFSDAIKYPRDVNDCVAVPRGIFKAYLLIMGGTGLIAIANLLPSKLTKSKKGLSIIGWVMNILSAWFFAKGFAVNGLNPTINRDEYNRKN